MTPNNDVDLRRQLEELRAENERLRAFNALLCAQRKEYLDALCGPAELHAPTEEEVAAGMSDLVPLEQVFAQLGISRSGEAK